MGAKRKSISGDAMSACSQHRTLTLGCLSQRAFDKRCHKISELPLPNWMDKTQSPPPAMVHTTLGKVQNYGPYPDRIDMPPIPLWLRRYKTAKDDKSAAA